MANDRYICAYCGHNQYAHTYSRYSGTYCQGDDHKCQCKEDFYSVANSKIAHQLAQDFTSRALARTQGLNVEYSQLMLTRKQVDFLFNVIEQRHFDGRHAIGWSGENRQYGWTCSKMPNGAGVFQVKDYSKEFPHLAEGRK